MRCQSIVTKALTTPQKSIACTRQPSSRTTNPLPRLSSPESDRASQLVRQAARQASGLTVNVVEDNVNKVYLARKNTRKESARKPRRVNGSVEARCPDAQGAVGRSVGRAGGRPQIQTHM